ncbi:MAG: hypothetical protein LBD31_01695 [Treponema sp.]|jgi:hypothetical protein|nr:hypothetical protein [Treponema sp.]
MKKFCIAVLAGYLAFAVPGCRNNKNGVEDIPYVPESDPLSVLPTVVDDETDAEIYEVPTPEPLRDKKGETVYPIYYRGAVATTKNKGEWESWLRDPSLAPLPALRNDRNFVVTWCHQFAHYEPEEVALILMNYFEYDMAYLHPSNPWCYTDYPKIAFFNWAGLRTCIEAKKVVCAGYAQLFYLIVREQYPDVRYITSNEIRHARNYFADTKQHWDITWIDTAGVNYNPDYIKFDFVGMKKRIDGGLDGDGLKVGRDWKIVNLVAGER